MSDGKKNSNKYHKSSARVMEETFVMVAFSFIFGTLLSGAFLWVLSGELMESKIVDSKLDVRENIPVENKHYDLSDMTEDDYELMDYASELEAAIVEYCSGANLSGDTQDAPLCPEDLEMLVPDYLESVDEIGGDWDVFLYAQDEEEFELAVQLGNGAKEIMENDGGNNEDYYELGTDLTLLK